jgi:hypothetical protein
VLSINQVFTRLGILQRGRNCTPFRAIDANYNQVAKNVNNFFSRK